ncbi:MULTISPECIES: GGDEF domain-containing protein [Massilia]|jgi:diguanylate cyclase (GGDEF)-like protein|uniref:GGDEF domain-containing protein n=1 Tax=Massilia TaxID=149698 RepID=UPI001C6275B9|nr:MULTISPECIES: GGDEF domain-containing protein [Massilia]QYG00684.1 GGDEF domain-containing protein [Massilia sp. NP310]
MSNVIRHALLIGALLGAFAFLFVGAGVVIPMAEWDWVDIASEGGTSLLAALWCLIVLSSRPDGLVTRLLSSGLACIMLGSWADCLDEVVDVDKAALWDNALESLLPLGMLVLTVGMAYWRLEQATLSDHMRKRERLFRNHRPFDRITQLADAAYLREQLRLESRRNDGQGCALVLFDIDEFHRINREHGQAEGDRVLQAVAHMLLLNLRNEDLLCRYAGDRFAVLMPGLHEGEASDAAQHLCRMVSSMRHHAPKGRVRISLRHGCAPAQGAPDALLSDLCRQMDAV